MKITDVIVSLLIKKGVLYEAKECDMEFEIPIVQENEMDENVSNTIKVRFKADNMILRIERE